MRAASAMQGVVQQLGHAPDGTAQMIAKVAQEMETEEEQWIAALRAQGVKAAHPDDGWVNRKENFVCFCYPQFNDGPKVGDLIALGWPGGPPKYKRNQWRLVRVTAVGVGNFSGMKVHYFEAEQ